MNEITIIFVGLIAHVYPLDGLHQALMLGPGHHDQILSAPAGTASATAFPPATSPIAGHDGFNIVSAWFEIEGEIPQNGIGNSPIPHLPRFQDISNDWRLESGIGSSHPRVAARLRTKSRDIAVGRYYEYEGKFPHETFNRCVPCEVIIKVKANKGNPPHQNDVHLMSGNRSIYVKNGTTIYIGNLAKNPGGPSHFPMHGDIVKGSVPDLKELSSLCMEPAQKCKKPWIRLAGVECGSTNWP